MDNRPLLFSPPGEWVTTRGIRLHVHWSRARNPRTILFETGLTMMSAAWGWLRQELAGKASLLFYDRAGLGWSDEKEGVRESRTIAEELSGLLGTLQLTPPYILAGHSIGAIYNRAFLKLHPEQVAACIWLDPSHPRQMERSRTIRRKMRNFFIYLEAAHLLASKNLPRLNLPLMRQIGGLPQADHHAARHFFRDARHLRTSAREARAWTASADFVEQTTLGTKPLLILSAQKNAMKGWAALQNDLSKLSNCSKQVVFSDASHISLLTDRAHAGRAASEILNFLAEQRL